MVPFRAAAVDPDGALRAGHAANQRSPTGSHLPAAQNVELSRAVVADRHLLRRCPFGARTADRDFANRSDMAANECCGASDLPTGLDVQRACALETDQKKFRAGPERVLATDRGGALRADVGSDVGRRICHLPAVQDAERAGKGVPDTQLAADVPYRRDRRSRGHISRGAHRRLGHRRLHATGSDQRSDHGHEARACAKAAPRRHRRSRNGWRLATAFGFALATRAFADGLPDAQVEIEDDSVDVVHVSLNGSAPIERTMRSSDVRKTRSSPRTVGQRVICDAKLTQSYLSSQLALRRQLGACRRGPGREIHYVGKSGLPWTAHASRYFWHGVRLPAEAREGVNPQSQRLPTQGGVHDRPR
ncbi:hypothetical protein D9M72_434410 [compost metagenome]